jgi:hypothetical protein
MSIKLHGKEYVEVKDRVAEAHAEDGYSMLKETTFELGGRIYVQVTIDVKGKMYIGTAECKFNANPKTPDGQSPFECGETSALGRALGFAGYGAVESIASADEVARNEQPAIAPLQPTSEITAPVPSKLRKMFQSIGTTLETAQKMKWGVIKPDDNLTPEECYVLHQVYDAWKIKFDEKKAS